MELYVAELFTGATSTGVYSSLEQAQQAVQNHFAAMGFADAYNAQAWFGIGTAERVWRYHRANEVTDNMISNVYITKYILDAPIEFA